MSLSDHGCLCAEVCCEFAHNALILLFFIRLLLVAVVGRPSWLRRADPLHPSNAPKEPSFDDQAKHQDLRRADMFQMHDTIEITQTEDRRKTVGTVTGPAR